MITNTFSDKKTSPKKQVTATDTNTDTDTDKVIANLGQVPVKKFVIMHVRRVGSNYLCSLLGSHPDILCHHELFNPKVIGVSEHLHGNTDFALTGYSLEQRDQDPLDFLEEAWSWNLGAKHVGFKLCQVQNQVIYEHVLRNHAIQKIILKRENPVKTYASLLLAEQTQRWVQYQKEPHKPGPDSTPHIGKPSSSNPNVMFPNPQDRKKVHVTVDGLMKNMANDVAYYQGVEIALAASGQKSLVIFYEDLCATPSAVLNRVLDYLHALGPRDLSSSMEKLAPDNLKNLISNYSELKAELRQLSLSREAKANLTAYTYRYLLSMFEDPIA